MRVGDERLSGSRPKSLVGDGPFQEAAQAEIGSLEVAGPREIGFTARNDQKVDLAV